MKRSFKVVGSGIYLPGAPVLSTVLDERHHLARGTIEARCGVSARHYAEHQSASEMAQTALDAALRQAGLTFADVDTLIAASGTMEQAIPCNAAKILARYPHNHGTTAFDINMTCLSALMAMETAASMLLSGNNRVIAIVSSDIASVGLNWQHIETAGLFGDGAAALIVRAAPQTSSTLDGSLFRTYPQGVDYCQIAGGGSLFHPSKVSDDYHPYGMFQMQGRDLYRLTAKVIGSFIDELLNNHNTTLDQIDWVVPHQASGAALEHLIKRLSVDPDKVVQLLASRGNQIAVSLPAALHELLTTRSVKTGDRIMMIGTSAGLSLGGVLLTL